MADFSNPIVIGVTITEYITFMLICIINSKILKSYKNKKQKLSQILLTTIILFSLAPIVHSLDAFFFDSWSLNNLGYIIGLGYSMAMIFAGIANFFLSKFIKNLFEETT
jgi:sulfite exporter TauE/SafE